MMNIEELNKEIESLCNSKSEEFALLGYEHISGADVWQCVSAIKKYDEDNLPQVHQIVNDILTLKVTTFMNWMTLNAYKGI